MAADRLLLPLAEEQSAVEMLTTYRTETELADALGRIRAAVERVLRLLLRSDADAADEVRLTALSPAHLPAAELIAELRRRERISIDLAGLVHVLDEVAGRAETGNVRAADADAALAVVERLTGELAPQPAAADAETMAPEGSGAPDPVGVVVAGRGRGRRWLWAPVLLALVAAVAVAVWPRPRMERAVQAFREGRWAEAERLFIERAARDGDATSLLYLARMYRADGRHEEAADALRRAVEVAPEDADIRRELGYLFLDLDRPDPAIEQFRRAQELGPAESLNWIGLIRALRAAGSPEADEWLARAPVEVREKLGADSVGG